MDVHYFSFSFPKHGRSADVCVGLRLPPGGARMETTSGHTENELFPAEDEAPVLLSFYVPWSGFIPEQMKLAAGRLNTQLLNTPEQVHPALRIAALDHLEIESPSPGGFSVVYCLRVDGRRVTKAALTDAMMFRAMIGIAEWMAEWLLARAEELEADILGV